MIDWLQNNKEWLFGGIGTTIISVIVSVILLKKKQVNISQRKNENILTSEKENINIDNSTDNSKVNINIDNSTDNSKVHNNIVNHNVINNSNISQPIYQTKNRIETIYKFDSATGTKSVENVSLSSQ